MIRKSVDSYDTSIRFINDKVRWPPTSEAL